MEAQRCDWTSFSAGGIDELCDSWIPSALSAENEWRWDYLWNLWRAFLFNSMNTQETHKVSQNMVSAETMPAWLKGTETGWNVRNLLDFRNSMGRKQAYYTTHVQICATLQEKGKVTPRVQPQGTDYYPLALKPCPTGVWNDMGWVTDWPFIFSFGMGMS